METFEKILKEVPKDVNTKNYAFHCSTDIRYNKEKYKGFEVFKFEKLKEDTIIFSVKLINKRCTQ